MTQQPARAPLDMALPGIPAPPRPKALSDEQEQEVAREIAGRLATAGLLADGDDLDEVAAEIRAAAGTAWPHDGYQIAKWLDSHRGWSPDARMVEVLDDYHDTRDGRLRRLQAEWAEAWRIQPPLPVGARVRFRFRCAVATGEIAGTSPPAQYLLTVDGDPRMGSDGKSRQLLNFEDVEPLEAAAAAEGPA